MNVTFAAYKDNPDAQQHINLILTNLTAYDQFSAPIYLATVYQDRVDIVLEDGSTRQLWFCDRLPSLTVWPEMRAPREKIHEDRRIALSAKVITGYGQN